MLDRLYATGRHVKTSHARPALLGGGGAGDGGGDGRDATGRCILKCVRGIECDSDDDDKNERSAVEMGEERR